MRTRRLLALVSAVVAVSMLTACVGGGGGGAPSDPRSGAGLQYGLAPRPDQGVTFDKNVVLVDGGAASVRSVTADGLTWTLSPAAGGIADLAPGRVMFLTDRAVGEVRAVQTTSAGVVVTIAPVSMTQVIHDGRLASSKPIPITDPVVVSSAGAFWDDPTLQQQAGVAAGQSDVDVPTDVPASDITTVTPPTIPRPPAPPASVTNIVKSQTGAFKLASSCCNSGPGSDFAYDNKGLRMTGSVHLAMQKPTAEFNIDISGASFKSASIRLTGGGSLQAEVHAATQPNALIVGYSPPLGAAFSFYVPIGVFFGVPLNLVVNQRFTVGVDIPGTATLDATGKVDLGSVIAFSYDGKGFHNDSSAHIDSDASLKATNSIAVGISYATFNYNVRFTIGFGVAGFVVGVYIALGVHLLGAVGAPIGFNPAQGAQDPIEHCRVIQGVVSVDYGVGYTVPAPVAKVINFFLKAFQSEPIKTQGGLSAGWHTLATATSVYPNSGFCTKK